MGQTYDTIKSIYQFAQTTYTALLSGKELFETSKTRLDCLIDVIGDIAGMIPDGIYDNYKDGLEKNISVYRQCLNEDAFRANGQNLTGALAQTIQSFNRISEECLDKIKVCACCNNEVMYAPLPSYYAEMNKKYSPDYTGKMRH